MIIVPTVLCRSTKTSSKKSSSTANCNQTSLLLYGGNARMEHSKNDKIVTYEIAYDGHKFYYSNLTKYSLDSIISSIIDYSQELYDLTVREFYFLPIQAEHGHVSLFLLFLRLS